MLNKGTFEGGRVHITDKQTVQIYTQGLYKIVLELVEISSTWVSFTDSLFNSIHLFQQVVPMFYLWGRENKQSGNKLSKYKLAARGKLDLDLWFKLIHASLLQSSFKVSSNYQLVLYLLI